MEDYIEDLLDVPYYLSHEAVNDWEGHADDIDDECSV